MRFSYFDFKWTSFGRRRLKRLGVGQAHVTLSCRAARASIVSFIDPCGVEDSALFPITPAREKICAKILLRWKILNL